MYEGAVQDLIDELGRLPGIGPKGAQRIAFHLLQADPQDVERLSDVLLAVKEKVRYCERCFNVAESQLCRVCADQRRDQSAICVVEEPKDVVAIERTREFRGTYHVLGGLLSALGGTGPEDLSITPLLRRIEGDGIEEVILALPATVDGATTTHYLTDRLKPTGCTITRLAQGVPIGGALDVLDDGTLTAAFKARRAL